MSINGVIDRFKTGVYVVTRVPEGTLEDGELIPANVTEDVIIVGVDPTLDTLDAPAHGLATGSGPFRLVGGGALGGGIIVVDLPSPLSDAAQYWVIRVDDDTLMIATSNADAIAEIPVDILSTGTGGLALSVTRFQCVMSVQPDSGRELDAMIESDRTSERKLILCAVEIRTRVPGFEPDSIEILGESHTVTASERWDHWGTVHWRAFAERDEVT